MGRTGRGLIKRAASATARDKDGEEKRKMNHGQAIATEKGREFVSPSVVVDLLAVSAES